MSKSKTKTGAEIAGQASHIHTGELLQSLKLQELHNEVASDRPPNDDGQLLRWQISGGDVRDHRCCVDQTGVFGLEFEISLEKNQKKLPSDSLVYA